MPWLSSAAMTKSSGVPRTSSYAPLCSRCLSTSRNVLEADQQVVDHLGLEVPGDARDLSRRHLRADHDGRRRQPALLRQLAQLEVRQQGRDLVAGDETPVAVPSPGAMAPRRSASGSVARTRSALCSAARAAARSIDSGTSGFGVLVTLGNWPSGVICSATGMTLESPGRRATSMAVMRADAVQRREDDLKSSLPRRRHQALLAAQVDVGLVRRLIEEVDAAGTHRLGPRQRLDVRHLVDEVGHDLIVRRHRLAAAFVVELAAVVVGRIVRRRDVEAAVRP